jgi:hypothetical protein
MEHYKSLRGNRILLDFPDLEESNLILDDATKEALKQDQVLKFDRLKVYAVGDTVTDIKPGDEVFMDPISLKHKGIQVIVGGELKIVTSPFDVILVW